MDFFEAKRQQIQKTQMECCSFPFVKQGQENKFKAEVTRVPFVGGKQTIIGVYIRYSLPAICHLSEIPGFKPKSSGQKEEHGPKILATEQQVAWTNVLAHAVTKTIDIKNKGLCIQENSNAFLWLMDHVAPGVRENMHSMIGLESLFSKRVEAAKEKTEYFANCFSRLKGRDVLELEETPVEFHLELVPLDKFYVSTDNSPPYLLEFKETRAQNIELLKENLATALAELVMKFVPRTLGWEDVGVELFVNIQMNPD
jgi:hypothetical protein